MHLTNRLGNFCLGPEEALSCIYLRINQSKPHLLSCYTSHQAHYIPHASGNKAPIRADGVCKIIELQDKKENSYCLKEIKTTSESST